MGIKMERKQALNIESILIHIGEFGLYQKLHAIISLLVTLVVSFQILIMFFLTLTPTWICNNISIVCTTNFNGTQQPEVRERCNLPIGSWRYTEEREYSLVTQFHICSNEWLLDLLQSMHFFGWGVGAVVLGRVGDILGRKKLLFPSYAAIVVFGSITVFIKNIYVILLLRFITGFFLPGVMVQTKLLIAEIVGNKKRPLAVMIPFFAYPIGYSTLALKSYLLRNWKHLAMACTLPYLFVFPFYFFITESPKWLYARGRTDEAMQALQRIARWNGTQLEEDIEILQEIKNCSSDVDTDETVSCNSQLVIEVIIQCILWYVSHMSFFGLQMAAKELQGSMYINFVLLSLMEMPALLLIILCSSKFGRKKTVLISMICTSAACSAIAFVPKQFVLARVALGLIGKLLASVHGTTIYVWSTELLPTSVRSGIFGVLQFSSRLGASSAPWVVKGLTPMGEWIPFVVLGVSTFIGGIVGNRLKETKVSYNQEKH